MTDKERDQFDIQAQQFFQSCTDALRELEAELGISFFLKKQYQFFLMIVLILIIKEGFQETHTLQHHQGMLNHLQIHLSKLRVEHKEMKIFRMKKKIEKSEL